MGDHAAEIVARFACGAGRMAPHPNPGGERESRAQILEDLLRSKRAALINQARFHSAREEDADDALGDAAVQFLRFYDGPPGQDALRWMMVVTKRCAWAISRRSRAHGSTVVVEVTDGAAAETSVVVPEERRGPAEAVERAEDASEVSELFGKLKPDERTALVLLGLGFSYKEIAQMQGWTITKVNRCIAEGRAALRSGQQAK